MINCLLLDDDPSVLYYMENFVRQTPFLHLVASHSEAAGALRTIGEGQVQLCLMDIGLPGMNGLELSRVLLSQGKSAPKVIFVTSFDQYALEGYKVNAADYLLKPITYETFLEAVLRVKNELEASPAVYTEHDFVFVRVEQELQKIYLKDIIYLEGFKDYVKIFTQSRPGFIRALTTMKSLEEKLPEGSFLRIHRSFIVAVDKIERITRTMVVMGNAQLPVSAFYREAFRKFTDKWF